jgi:hypothetical protein
MVAHHALLGNSVDTDADTSEFTYHTNGRKLKPEKLHFLLDRMIAFGSLTGLEGDMKGGKSTFAGALVADVTGGRRLPGGHKRRVLGPVLYYCREERHDQGVAARVAALGGDPNLIMWPRDIDGRGIANVAFPDHAKWMEACIVKEGVKLVVIDQLDSFVSGRYNLNLGQPTREVFDPLIVVAMRTGAAILPVRQLTKDQSALAIHRGAGSVAWGAACRSVLAVSAIPGKKDWRAVSRVCGNFGPPPPPLAFELKAAGLVAVPVWHPEFKVSEEELAAGQLDAVQRDEGDEATNLLKAYLKDEWVAYTTLRLALIAFGVSERTLRDRKLDLGVQHRQRGGQGKHWSEWHAPKGGWPK